MIIISQDKTIIINFNNAEAIEIGNVEENQGKGIIYVRLKSDYFYEIGEYRIEERAKEVLQEIIEVFTDEEMFHINKSSLNNLDELEEPKYILRPISRPKVYYMPKE